MYGEIIFQTSDLVSVAGAAAGNTSGAGALAASLAILPAVDPGETNLPIIPGTVSFSDGTNTLTDNGNGTLTGAPAGAGTINYTTGVFSLTAMALSTAVTVSYQNAGNNVDAGVITPIAQLMPNSFDPMFASVRAEQEAVGIILQASEKGGSANSDWITLVQRTFAPWESVDIGIIPMKNIRVFASKKARLNGMPVNAT